MILHPGISVLSKAFATEYVDALKAEFNGKMETMKTEFQQELSAMKEEISQLKKDKSAALPQDVIEEANTEKRIG